MCYDLLRFLLCSFDLFFLILDCVKTVVRFFNGKKFMVILWNSIEGPLSHLKPGNYTPMLLEMRGSFFPIGMRKKRGSIQNRVFSETLAKHDEYDARA